MSFYGVNAGMETSTPLVNSVVNSAVSFQFTHESDTTSNHSHPALLSGRLVAPDIVVDGIEVKAVRRPQFWKFILSLRLLHFRTVFAGSE